MTSFIYFGFLNFRCDRIVWFGNGLKQIQYARSESKLSDHRPVKALFIAEVRGSATLKSFQSLFLSERFEQIKTHFEVSHTDEFVCKKQSSFRLWIINKCSYVTKVQHRYSLVGSLNMWILFLTKCVGRKLCWKRKYSLWWKRNQSPSIVMRIFLV